MSGKPCFNPHSIKSLSGSLVSSAFHIGRLLAMVRSGWLGWGHSNFLIGRVSDPNVVSGCGFLRSKHAHSGSCHSHSHWCCSICHIWVSLSWGARHWWVAFFWCCQAWALSSCPVDLVFVPHGGTIVLALGRHSLSPKQICVDVVPFC